MMRFTRSTSVRSTSVYSPRSESAPSSRLSSCTAPRMAPSGLRTSWASPTAIRPAAASVSPRRTSASSWRIREVAQHDDGGFDRAVATAQGRGDDRDGHPALLAPLHDALGLGAALAGGERLPEPAHDGGVGREDLLDVAPLGAPRRALGEHLGRGVPEDHAEVAIDRDHRVGEAGQDRFEVHCSGGLEAGFDRGWPEIDAAWLRHARSTLMPAPPLPLSSIPIVRSVRGVHFIRLVLNRGWR